MSEKPWEHFGGYTFCKVSFLKIFTKTIDSQLCECSWHVQCIFLCRKLLSTLKNTIEVNFPSFCYWLVFSGALPLRCIFEFGVLQLTGECFAPPSAMICAVAMSRADSGMGVGSSSFEASLQQSVTEMWITHFSMLLKPLRTNVKSQKGNESY